MTNLPQELIDEGYTPLTEEEQALFVGEVRERFDKQCRPVDPIAEPESE